MEPRINYKIASGGVESLRSLENYVKSSGLEPSLLKLVRIRGSQINQCAYWLDMHTKDARSGGEAAAHESSFMRPLSSRVAKRANWGPYSTERRQKRRGSRISRQSHSNPFSLIQAGAGATLGLATVEYR